MRTRRREPFLFYQQNNEPPYIISFFILSQREYGHSHIFYTHHTICKAEKVILTLKTRRLHREQMAQNGLRFCHMRLFPAHSSGLQTGRKSDKGKGGGSHTLHLLYASVCR